MIVYTGNFEISEEQISGLKKRTISLEDYGSE